MDCHGLIVCNARHYGGAFQLARRADLFTSGFEVICIHGPLRRDYLRLCLAVALGRVERCRGISVESATQVSVDGVATIQLDGDAWLKAPAIFTAESGGLRIIVAVNTK
jgi:diacylglycerol kinase family enzyme